MAKRVWIGIMAVGFALWMRMGNVYAEGKAIPERLSADGHTIALWNFDEDSGQIVLDASPNHNDGYLGMNPEDRKHDPVRERSSLNAGRMLRFSGLGHVVIIPNTQLLNSLENRFTIECLVNFSDFMGRQDLVSKKFDGTASGYKFGINNDRNGNTILHFLWGSSGAAEKTSISSCQFKLVTGTWYHVAVTYDGKELKFYVNNTSMGEERVKLTIAPNKMPVYLGAYRNYNKFSICGDIDEVRISAVARKNFPVLSGPPLMVIGKPDDDIFAWGRRLAEAAVREEVEFQIKTEGWQTEVREGSIIHAGDILEVTLDGADTGNYRYQFYLDGTLYRRTEHVVPINYRFPSLPGPHRLIISAMEKGTGAVVFGAQFGLITVDEETRILELPETTTDKLGLLLKKIEGSRVAIDNYSQKYDSVLKLYSEYAKTLSLIKLVQTKYPGCSLQPTELADLFIPATSIMAESVDPQDYLARIENILNERDASAKRTCDTVLDKLEKYLTTEKNIPRITNFPKRLIAPFATGAFRGTPEKELILRSIKNGAPFGNCDIMGGWSRSKITTVLPYMDFMSKVGWPIMVVGSHGWPPPKKAMEKSFLCPEEYRLLKLMYGDYMYALFFAEFDGGAGPFARSPEPKDRLQAMNNFVRNYRHLSSTLCPEGVLSVHASDFGFDNSYLLLAGADVINSQLWRAENVEVFMSATRGACRAFGKAWGGNLTHARGVHTPRLRKEGFVHTSPEDNSHLLTYLYFNGSTSFMHENWANIHLAEYRKVWEDFYRFTQEHPEPGDLRDGVSHTI